MLKVRFVILKMEYGDMEMLQKLAESLKDKGFNLAYWPEVKPKLLEISGPEETV